jgi:hypothetical protein
MAKAGQKAPIPKITLIKEKGESSAEVYIAVPVRLGEIDKRGRANYATSDGGKGFPTLVAAVAHLLSTKPEYADLSQHAATYMAFRPSEPEIPATSKTIEIPGIDLVSSGAWPKFCQARGIDSRDMSQIQKTHSLSVDECKVWGIK